MIIHVEMKAENLSVWYKCYLLVVLFQVIDQETEDAG